MLRFAFTSMLWGFCLVAEAKAHPHIFVDARSVFLFTKDGHLGALRIFWTYDRFTTLFLFDTLGLDHDGRINTKDHAKILSAKTDLLPDNNGGVFLEVDGQDRRLTAPENETLFIEGDRITVTFDLPLKKPADVSGGTTILRLYDPAYYYTYRILPKTEQPHLPQTCTSEIISQDLWEADAALDSYFLALTERNEKPKQLEIGRFYADEVRLTCR
ncbi:MAG: DUF1007 family protein [Sulfitobacter sp.]